MGLIILLALTILGTAEQQPEPKGGPGQDPIATARNWLVLLDHEQWNKAVDEFKGDLSRDYLRSNLPRWRGAIGKIRSREFRKRTDSTIKVGTDTVSKTEIEFQVVSDAGARWLERVTLERVNTVAWWVLAYGFEANAPPKR